MTTINNINTILSNRTSGTEILCAVPYNGYTLPAFYFSSEEEYEVKLEAAKELDQIKNWCGDYEHEIQFIDGEGSQKMVDSANSMEEYFDLVTALEAMNDHQQAALGFLHSHMGLTIQQAMENIEEVNLTTDSATDYAYELAEESGLSGFALNYFDAEKFARDMDLNGEIQEYRHNNTDYLITNVQAI